MKQNPGGLHPDALVSEMADVDFRSGVGPQTQHPAAHCTVGKWGHRGKESCGLGQLLSRTEFRSQQTANHD